MVTADPFDLSGDRMQASVKKVPAATAWHHIIPANSEAQGLGETRAKLLNAAVSMGPKGLPNAEFVAGKDKFPCDYCEWKTRCQVVDKNNFGVYFPTIPEAWTVAPPGVSEQAAA